MDTPPEDSDASAARLGAELKQKQNLREAE
jgi:hypothetical protein